MIHAGSGGVGHFAVQLARWKGAYVFATASTKNQDLLRELGVDKAIDYTQQRFEDVARNIDIVLDTIGGETQERSWSVLKKDGVLVSLVQPPSEEKVVVNSRRIHEFLPRLRPAQIEPQNFLPSYIN